MKKIQLKYSASGKVLPTDEDIDFTTATADLDLETGEVILHNFDTEGDLISIIEEEEISCLGETYSLIRSTDDTRTVSSDNLDKIKLSLGLNQDYTFVLKNEVSIFDLLSYAKDEFYTSVEEELNLIDTIKDISIEEMGLELVQENGDFFIETTLIDFTIDQDQ